MGLAYRRFENASSVSSFLGGAEDARLLGGGTLILRRINEGDATIATLVRLADPALKRVEITEDSVRLGAGVTMAQILAHSDLACLAPSAKLVGGPAVRAAATVGGNLFAASPYGDLGVALLALDATVHLADESGAIDQALSDFFATRAGLPPGRIVVAVSFARPGSDGLRFLKVSRVKPKGAAVLTIAAVVATEGGRVSQARVALGAMAQAPMRAKAFEEALQGRPLAPDTIEAALPAALDGTDPVPDAIASAWYRRTVLPVHLRRLLLAGS